MNILEAYDLTGSFRDAGELAGCSHHTVARYVRAREEGRLVPGAPSPRPGVIDEYLPKLEELVERSKGRVRADVAHEKIAAMGYAGSERTTRRAVARLKEARSGADPGQQLATEIPKGSRAVQQLPASPDTFVWLRLYQQEMRGVVPTGPDDPLWWTLRRPFRPLAYHAARAMFDRANAAAGTGWTLHSLRHTAAYRLARDPGVPMSDVQWVPGHQSLATTQIYVVPTAEDVIESTLAHLRRQAEPKPALPAEPGPRYRPESLDVLFGKGRW